MANKLIHELPLASSVASADEIEIQKAGESTTKRIAVSSLHSLRSLPVTAGVTGYLYTDPITGQIWQMPSFDELLDLPETNAYLATWLARIQSLEALSFHGNQKVSGDVTWLSGLVFRVSDLVYYIGNQLYTANGQDVTLSAADSTDPRIDVIYCDTNGNIGALEGIAATPPIKPTVDDNTQLELTFATIDATEIVPTGITNELVYNENLGNPTEWAASYNSGVGHTVDFNYATAPYNGTKCIHCSGTIPNTMIAFAKGSGFDMAGSKITFPMKTNKTWTVSSAVLVWLFNSGGQICSPLVMHDGNFSFSSALHDTWQLVSIDIALFGLSAFTVDTIKISYAGTFTNGTTIDLDFINVQKGVAPPAPPPAYVLPIATASVLGGFKVGANLSINPTTGVLDASFTSPTSGAYKGVAMVATNPGSPAADEFWLAGETGTFTNFGALVVNSITGVDNWLCYDFGTTTWTLLTLPSTQVNTDWNAVSGKAQLLNKPTIPSKTSDLSNDSGFITSFSGMVECKELIAKDIIAGTPQVYDLLLKAMYGFTINSIELETDTGTLTGIIVKINSTTVTGMSAVTASSTLGETLATAANTVVAGDRIYLYTSSGYTGLPTTLKIQLNYTRT